MGHYNINHIWIPSELNNAAKKVSEGESQKVTVKTLLRWFNARRRGYLVVHKIRTCLEAVQLRTSPDFEVAFYDDFVELLPVENMLNNENENSINFEPSGNDQTDLNIQQATITTQESATTISTQEIQIPHSEYADPVPRIGNLASANKTPISVNRDAKLSEAITFMMMYDYSQLPVMQNDRIVNGYISWATIGKSRAIKSQCDLVRDCLDETVTILDYNAPLLNAVELIANKGFILVRSVDKRITGLVTTSDITQQFQELAEPFLIIGQIEGHLRRLIGERYSIYELNAAKDPSDTNREVKSVSDLTFGEYLRLLQKPENWNKLNYPFSQEVVLNQLDEVRSVRNEIMHFHPDPVEQSDMDLLHRAANFLQNL